MSSGKLLTFTSPRTADDLFAAVLVAVQDGPYHLGGLSHERHEIVFSRGGSALSWGHVFGAVVLAKESGAELRLNVVNAPGATPALLDGRKNKLAGNKVLEAVRVVLDQPTTPSPEPVTSFATLPDGSTVPWTDGEYPEG